MDPVEALRRCGGRATWAQLNSLEVRKRDLAAAVSDETLVRSRLGHYRLASLDTDLDTAISLSATLARRSAANHYDLKVWTAPEKPEVIVPRNRKVPRSHQQHAITTWRDLPRDTIKNGVTTPFRTVLDCALDLPFTESLAVADSALRDRFISNDQLTRAVGQLRGPRVGRARLVAQHASGLAANPFESATRALAIESGLNVRPQVQLTEVGVWGLVDLIDESRRLVIEAESFEFHAERKGFRKDVRRYSTFAVFGWTVIRFTWEDVTFHPDYVRWALESFRRRVDAGLTPTPPPALPRMWA
ncbi:DUF559 domain-containing protein [Ornithinimicrobium sp. Y1847]|uniref:DUF559 domain-containing protein n=1 Tax=Ornithinimicrobium sp. Y1847 TaxID=3405419 RepID=UPI003B67FEDB